jgi:hypothetical protein
MSNLVAWIAAEAERPRVDADEIPPRRGNDLVKVTLPPQGLVAHQFPASVERGPAREVRDEVPAESGTEAIETTSPDCIEFLSEEAEVSEQEDRARRVYRKRTVTMLRRYMRYSIETGRLPSLLGTEFFRAKVTAYTVVTFEDRVIFVHDMEKCLSRLDEFSRQLIARHIMQEHDRWATAKLLHCNEKTVRRYVPVALDLLSHILVEVGLMQRLDSIPENSCQGGKSGPFSASDCEDGENKF